MSRRGLVALLVVSAAVLVPSAAAARKAAVKLPLVPLQRSQLGAVARSLALEHDSGVVSNSTAASNANGADVTAKQLAKLGRRTGYQLDYGDPFLPGNGVREIETGVERYRNAAAAKRGLAFWRGNESLVASLAQAGVRASLTAVRPPAVGTGRWAVAVTLEIPGTSPVYGLDEDVQDGSYVIMVSVGAGSPGAARRLAPKLAKQLDARLRAGLAGKLRGRPAKLPRLKAGPPPSGPDPAQAALTTSDFSQATLTREKYTADAEAVSEYDVGFAPAGAFADVFQQIVAQSTPSEATYYAALLAGSVRSYDRGGNTVTPVDLSGVGDDAYAALLQLRLSGQTVYEAAVVLANGPLVELIVGASKTQLADADVTSLAQAAAARLNAAVAG